MAKKKVAKKTAKEITKKTSEKKAEVESAPVVKEEPNPLLATYEARVKSGILVSEHEAEGFASGERTALLRGEQFSPLQMVQQFITDEKSYGFIRFGRPEYLHVGGEDGAVSRSEETLMSGKDIAALWPKKSKLFLYSVAEIVLFDKPRKIHPIEGDLPLVKSITIK